MKKTTFAIIFAVIFIIIGFGYYKTNDLKEKANLPIEYILPVVLYEDNRDLTVLYDFEKEKYEEFRKNYDNSKLKGVEPFTIFKMYLYSAVEKDMETQYELYTDINPTWTKEQHMEMNVMSDFAEFKKTYGVEVIYNTNNEENKATVTWYSENGYVDKDNGPFKYSFGLTKENEIWKVDYMPMQ